MAIPGFTNVGLKTPMIRSMFSRASDLKVQVELKSSLEHSLKDFSEIERKIKLVPLSTFQSVSFSYSRRL